MTTIVCMRVDAEVYPRVPCRIGQCHGCSSLIHVALTTRVVEGARYMCLNCMMGSNKTKIITPPRSRMDDLMDWVREDWR